MSFFSNLFGNSEAENTSKGGVNWIPLQHLGQLDELIAFSNQKPVLIFKHSTRCSISRFALKQFEKEFDLNTDIDAYFLDLLEFRSISNEIATRFGVEHQSPQLLLIKDEKAIYNTSHDGIAAGKLKDLI